MSMQLADKLARVFVGQPNIKLQRKDQVGSPPSLRGCVKHLYRITKIGSMDFVIIGPFDSPISVQH
ncbi:hypothetical protein ABID08_000303 [Rhizobium binae]|uniref:Type II toxin-antitoxin system RelE/ParE family toxin n=1 Tax=Rhizobium binae TaxID=1138190 RepID=A0ABV2M922_9HYPH